jgi:hypothetical protein
MSEKVEIRKFAEKVERLCDFLLSKYDLKDDSSDIKVIEDLKEEAANIQFGWAAALETLDGLDDFMRGLPPAPEDKPTVVN